MRRKFIKFLAIIIIGISHFSCGGIPGYLIEELSSNPIEEGGNKYLKITSHLEGASINSFEETFTGTCDDSYMLTVTEISSSLSIISSSCTGTNLTITVGFKASYGSNEARSFSVTNGEEALVRSVDFRLDCPTGYIGVPGNSEPYIETDDFCVAKYEMKAELVSNGELAASGDGYNGGTSFPDFSLIKPSSRYDGTPWVNIQRGETSATLDSALNECHSLDDGTFDYYLIHNSQWQTIARNIEENEDNWIDDNGTLKLPRGNSDIAKDGNCITGTTMAIESTINDNDGYFCTGNNFFQGYDADSDPGGKEQRRTNFLSNGEIIWDLAGNVSEWVAGDMSDYGNGIDIDPDPVFSVTFGSDYTDVSKFPLTGNIRNRQLFGPKGNFSKNEGIGAFYGSPEGAIIRGGTWDFHAHSGIFYALLLYETTQVFYQFGFRCASTPYKP